MPVPKLAHARFPVSRRSVLPVHAAAFAGGVIAAAAAGAQTMTDNLLTLFHEILAAIAGFLDRPLGPPDADHLTLWAMIQNGGVILWIIIALSVFAFMLALYFFLTITPRREAPRRVYAATKNHILAGNYSRAYQMCEGRDDLLSRVVRAGLKMSGRDRHLIQDAMESEGERGANALWHRISYLNNIGVIAPLLGLLGTVWGMIQAFGAIALDDSQVRGLTMAYSVSQAMITTAAGLVLAIPAMAVYFYLRGRVMNIVSAVESQAAEFIELLSESDNT